MENTVNYENRLTNLTDDDGKSIGNFAKVFEQVCDIDKRSFDITAQVGDISFVPELHGINLRTGENQSFPLSNWALGQVCNKIDVPIPYVKRCLSTDSPEMIVDHLNYWIKKTKQSANLTLRLTDNCVHGFMSSHFAMFDDVDILGIIDEYMPKDQFVIKNSLVSPEIMNIRIVSRETIKTSDGDDLHLAMNTKNSRVGQSSVVNQMLLYKWICSNGVIFGGGMIPQYRKIHVGEVEKPAREYFSRTISNLPQIKAHIESYVEKAKSKEVNQKFFEEIMEKFEAKKLPKITNEEMLGLVPKYGKMTVMNVVNAFTEIAQRYSSDARESIEEFSGNLILAA